MRVNCLAQEHNAVTRPGLEPGHWMRSPAHFLALAERQLIVNGLNNASCTISAKNTYAFVKQQERSHWQLTMSVQ